MLERYGKEPPGEESVTVPFITLTCPLPCSRVHFEPSRLEPEKSSSNRKLAADSPG
jgi:hypothetical protein